MSHTAFFAIAIPAALFITYIGSWFVRLPWRCYSHPRDIVDLTWGRKRSACDECGPRGF